MKGFASLVFALVALPLIAGVAIVACYATTGPVLTCAQDPTQSWCPQPIHDERQPTDGGK